MGAISLPSCTGLDCLNQISGEVVENIPPDLHALKKLSTYRVKAEFFHVRDKFCLMFVTFTKVLPSKVARIPISIDNLWGKIHMLPNFWAAVFYAKVPYCCCFKTLYTA